MKNKPIKIAAKSRGIKHHSEGRNTAHRILEKCNSIYELAVCLGAVKK